MPVQQFYFDVTVKVEHEGHPVDTVLYKAARAADEHRARRAVLCDFLGRGFQVLRLVRVVARPRGAGAGPPAFE